MFSWSTLRERYFKEEPATLPKYAGYVGYRFRVRLSDVPGVQAEGEYGSALGGPFRTILMHIAMDNGEDWLMGGTLVAMPESEVG